MLARPDRLRKKTDFSTVARRGLKTYSPLFIVYYMRPQAANVQTRRFGIVVSQKVAKSAVIRNRIRRWVRSDVYKIKNELPTGDYMLVVKAAAKTVDHSRLRNDLYTNLRIANEKSI